MLNEMPGEIAKLLDITYEEYAENKILTTNMATVLNKSLLM